MTVVWTRGDLFASPSISAYAHGCNCAGAMGAGIAAEFAHRWPAMYREYRRRCREGKFGLGDVFTWQEGGATTFNLGTQAAPGSPADLGAIRRSLATMLDIAVASNVARIGMPRIGAGLGGRRWEDVRPIIEDVAGRQPVPVLVVFEEYVPGLAWSGGREESRGAQASSGARSRASSSGWG